ncbi:MAG TPA: hypothetical protein DCQ50_20360 [Chryseobacterium sp.]|nr:hypothetical protein [Chryseobacterium sp.]
MENDILFTETQKFKKWWLVSILVGINGLFLFGVYKQVIMGQQFGNNPMGNLGLVILTVVTLLLTLIFLNFCLDTIIKKDGIYVRFFPFHLKFQYYSWDRLTKVFVRKYSPILEYGGWGFRLGFFGKETAYTVSGDKGLQLEFTDNKRLLIGTNKPEELIEALRKIGKTNQ